MQAKASFTLAELAKILLLLIKKKQAKSAAAQASLGRQCKSHKTIFEIFLNF